MWEYPWGIEVRDVAHLWALIAHATFSLKGRTTIVWRGLASSSYDVSSTLGRQLRSNSMDEAGMRAAELEILEEARKWGLGHSEFGHVSDLHLLASLQHHGAPTRLIDCSYNPHTALWFACNDQEHRDSPGVLVALAVSELTTVSTVPSLVQPTWGSMGNPLGWDLSAALEASAADETPFLVVPTVRDERMKAQEGLFISSAFPERKWETPLYGLPYTTSWFLANAVQESMVGNGDIRGDRWGEFGAMGLVLSPTLKGEVLPILERSYNRSARTLFPDVAGFVTHRLPRGHVNLEE